MMGDKIHSPHSKLQINVMGIYKVSVFLVQSVLVFICVPPLQLSKGLLKVQV